ncbi:MAG: hypothetical protein Q9167_003721 [Letrouitia subvulpina]
MAPPQSQHNLAVPAHEVEQKPSGHHSTPTDSKGSNPSFSQLALSKSFSHLNVTGEPPKTDFPMAEQMFPSLGVIFQHAADQGLNLGIGDWNAALLRADRSSRNGYRDLEVLRWIRRVLDQLVAAGFDELAPATEVLANASRDDTNRDRAISQTYLPSILKQLHNDDVAEICISVIYNICNDYGSLPDAEVVNRLLIDDLSPCANRSIETVLQLIRNPKLEDDDLLVVINVTKAFVQHERFQRYLVSQGSVTTLLACLLRSYSSILSENPSLSITHLRVQSRDPEEEHQISLVRTALIQILSDLSAAPVFSETYSVNSSLVNTLVQWLSSSQDEIQHCACLMLGNVARSDEICRTMVTRYQVHDNLVGILRTSSERQVIYAALGFMKNLALPSENKSLIGAPSTIGEVSRFWATGTDPQIQHASVSLLRQLLNGCLATVQWLLASLSPDQDSPASEKTYLSLVLLLFGRTDDISTKVEIGRMIATICRCISTSSQGVPENAIRAMLGRLYSVHGDIARPLAMMVSQSRFPIIRSEGWFALALMARSRDGSAAVSEVLQQVEVFGALVSTITGQHINGNGGEARNIQMGEADNNRPDSGSSSSETRSEQAMEMQARDRENALVLVNELLKNRVRINSIFVGILLRFTSL